MVMRVMNFDDAWKAVCEDDFFKHHMYENRNKDREILGILESFWRPHLTRMKCDDFDESLPQQVVDGFAIPTICLEEATA